MIFKNAKINAFRTWGLLLTMLGMGLMVLGTAGIVFFGPSRQNICRNRIGVWPDYDAGESRHLLLGGYAIHECGPNSVSGMQ